MFLESIAITYSELEKLKSLLSKKAIWAVKFGKTALNKEHWKKFCEFLPNTSLTHLFVIRTEMIARGKLHMLDKLKQNRSKHNMFNEEDNSSVPVTEILQSLWYVSNIYYSFC